MAVQQCTVALLVAVALVSYAAEAGYAPAGPQPKATTEEQKLAEKANNAFKAAVAAAAAAPPEDKGKIFVKTFVQIFGSWSLEGVTDTSSTKAIFNSRVGFTLAGAALKAQGATPEAKYESFVAMFDKSLCIIVGIMKVHAGEEVKGPIPAGELKAMDQMDAAFCTAATTADAAPIKDRPAVFDSAFSKAIKETTGDAYEAYKFVPALESAIKKTYAGFIPGSPQDKRTLFEATLSDTIVSMAATPTAATPTAAAAGGYKV
ncbi:hypothetical protein VPH35_071196 [Triticum aestivum]|uniref:Pollen allergen Poa p IX/Phl p VI domain-containing protein n=1 Tax=Triticum aestivum TaxID=4565 RepID=A0A3B6IKR0_WHEAT|nr:pollen allergen KBG 41-like [Triticum aestivum]